MENQDHNNIEDLNKHHIADAEVETDYDANKADPLPAPTVNEPEDNGAGPAMKWIIPLAIVILLIVYFFFFRNNVSQ